MTPEERAEKLNVPCYCKEAGLPQRECFTCALAAAIRAAEIEALTLAMEISARHGTGDVSGAIADEIARRREE